MSVSIALLGAMGIVLAILALYRKLVARGEDDCVHIADRSGELISNQNRVAKTLKRLDRVGINLSIAFALYGLGLLGVYLYNGLMHPPS